MPFDPANVRTLPPSLRDPVEPPAIPPVERNGGGGPRRTHIEITVHVPAPPKRDRRVLKLIVVLLLLALVLG
jgi:hypothetical protein